MSQENTITLRGFVTADPKLIQPTSAHTPLTEIRVGSTPRRLNRATGEWEDGETSYYTVKCWRRLAVNVKGSLRKGDMVVIKGKFFTRTWVDDQQRPHTQLQVEADSVGHDLTYGWSMFNRGSQGGPASPRSQAEGAGDAGSADGADGADGADAEATGRDLNAAADGLEVDLREPDEADASFDPGPAEPGPGTGPADLGLAGSDRSDPEGADPEMADMDLEKLATGLNAMADIESAF